MAQEYRLSLAARRSQQMPRPPTVFLVHNGTPPLPPPPSRMADTHEILLLSACPPARARFSTPT